MTTPGQYAQIVLSCLNEAITAGPFPIPQEKICLRFGERVNPTTGTSEDECCTGLAWVRVASIESLVDPDDPNRCFGPSQRIQLELGTARCIPFGTVGAGPTCEQWTEATLKMDSDQQAMEAAVCCAAEAINEMPFINGVRIGEYQPFGPDGNCILGTLQMTIDQDCGCFNGA